TLSRYLCQPLACSQSQTVGRVALPATGPSIAQQCLALRLRHRQRRCAPAVMDKLAPTQRAIRRAARRRPRPDAEIFVGGVSWVAPKNSLKATRLKLIGLNRKCSPAAGINAAAKKYGLRHVRVGSSKSGYLNCSAR